MNDELREKIKTAFKPIYTELLGLVDSLNCSDHARGVAGNRVRSEINQFWHEVTIVLLADTERLLRWLIYVGGVKAAAIRAKKEQP